MTYQVEGEAPHSTIAPLDISAAKRHLGWEPRFTIASAFEDYLELKAARAQAADDDLSNPSSALVGLEHHLENRPTCDHALRYRNDQRESR